MFFFGSFEWYRKMKAKQYDKRYEDSPTGLEIAHKYNPQNEEITSVNWLNYLGDNDNIRHYTL